MRACLHTCACPYGYSILFGPAPPAPLPTLGGIFLGEVNCARTAHRTDATRPLGQNSLFFLSLFGPQHLRQVRCLPAALCLLLLRLRLAASLYACCCCALRLAAGLPACLLAGAACRSVRASVALVLALLSLPVFSLALSQLSETRFWCRICARNEDVQSMCCH